MEKIEFNFKFENANGLHARPAGELVKEVKENLTCDVTIDVPRLNKTAKADKLFTLMGLGVKQGEDVKVTVEGEKAVEEAEKLKNFLNEKFAPKSAAPVKIAEEENTDEDGEMPKTFLGEKLASESELPVEIAEENSSI